jgi:hypothetical protein
MASLLSRTPLSASPRPAAAPRAAPVVAPRPPPRRAATVARAEPGADAPAAAESEVPRTGRDSPMDAETHRAANEQAGGAPEGDRAIEGQKWQPTGDDAQTPEERVRLGFPVGPCAAGARAGSSGARWGFKGRRRAPRSYHRSCAASWPGRRVGLGGTAAQRRDAAIV